MIFQLINNQYIVKIVIDLNNFNITIYLDSFIFLRRFLEKQGDLYIVDWFGYDKFYLKRYFIDIDEVNSMVQRLVKYRVFS